MSLSINLSGRSSSITTCIYPPIHFNPTKRHEIALVRLETYNSIPNVDEKCNVFRYWVGEDRHDITVPTGAYELSDINDIIQEQLVEPDLLELKANTRTLKAVLSINDSRVKSCVQARYLNESGARIQSR